MILYEGGGKDGGTGDKKFDKTTLEAGAKVKNIFHQTDILGHDHLQKVGDDMRKHGSSEKTGFIEKELDFVKSLKGV